MTKRKLTPKQRVRKLYPDAAYCRDCRVIHKYQGGAGDIGKPRNELEAWADAARRLK